MKKKFLIAPMIFWVVFSASKARADHDCEGDTVICFDHHLGRHVTYFNTDSCGIYFDHHLGYHVVFPYCKASPCGGEVTTCFDHCLARHVQFTNKNSCSLYFDDVRRCHAAFGVCKH